MAPSDPEVFVDQVSILSSAKETVLLLGLLFLQTDSSTGVSVSDWIQSAILARITQNLAHEIFRQNAKIFHHPLNKPSSLL